MKLYQVDLSPFASRVRMQVYAKGLDRGVVELVAPPGGLGSAEYKAINPTGKVPALDLGGRLLPESEVICEYLEDVYPEPSLRPSTPLDRAQVRLLSRWVDLYGYPRMAPLYPQVDPARRDPAVVAQGLAAADESLGILERLLVAGGYRGGAHAVAGGTTLADCALVPMLFFVDAVLPMFGRTPAFGAVPAVAEYWRAAAAEPVAKRILGEMNAALAERMKSG
jgi:glutathione S-transferase